MIAGAAIIHLIALHRFGSNNPLGTDVKHQPEATVPFHPYYTIKDLFGLGLFLIVFSYFIFFQPNFFGEPDNYIPANPLVTPAHIVPEWYFLPFYAILRALPSKLTGVIAMFSAVGILFVVPFIDRHPTRSGRFRPYYKISFVLFVINWIVLGWTGSQSPEGITLWISRIATGYYFFHFLILLPVFNKYEPHNK